MIDYPILTLPDYIIGDDLTVVQWSYIIEASEYQLQRSLDSGDWNYVYVGLGLQFNDVVPISATTVEYRIRSLSENWNKSWDDIASLNRTWDDWAVLNITWASDISQWNNSSILDVKSPSDFIQAPDITVPKSVIQNNEFEVSWERINDATGYTLQRSLNSGSWNVVYTGNDLRHTDVISSNSKTAQYRIQAYVNRNKYTWDELASFQRTWNDWKALGLSWAIYYSEWKYSDIISIIAAIYKDLTYYIYRDGIPIAKTYGNLNFSDYTVVGPHRYFVVAISNDIAFTSNIIDLDIPLQHATLATIDTPNEYLELDGKKGGYPEVSYNYNEGYQENRYVGNNYPNFRKSNQHEKEMSVSFTLRGSDKISRLKELIERGENLVYRDRYNNREIGIVENFPLSYVPDGKYLEAADFNITITKTNYEERVDYD